MTVKEFAEMLDGVQYGHEMSDGMKNKAKEEGLVVIYGASDDLIELNGAIDDEGDVYEGGVVYFNENGILHCPNCDSEWRNCPYYENEKKRAKVVKAVWCGKGAKAAWTYEIGVPHACFNVYEGDDLYCQGIVFRLGDM